MPSPRSTARRALALTGVAAALAMLVIGGAAAQDRGERPRPPERAGRAESSAPEAERTEAEPDAPAGSEDVGAESEIVESGGSKVKRIRFTGLDVSGRLKSPQLLYFLGRMRAEFDRPRLPHRTFVPELERSAHGKAF